MGRVRRYAQHTRNQQTKTGSTHSLYSISIDLMKPLALLLAACCTLLAQDFAGTWTGTADTIDASGVKRLMPQTLKFKGTGKDLTVNQVSRTGTLIPLKVILDENGTRMTLMRELDFEGGEHIRWHLELKDGKLAGSIQCVHDAPKKWGVDWGGPLTFTRAAE